MGKGCNEDHHNAVMNYVKVTHKPTRAANQSLTISRTARLHLKEGLLGMVPLIAQLKHHRMFVTSVLEELAVSGNFLRNHTSCGDHSETAIVQLLCLHVLQFLRVCGPEAEGVEAQISWLVVFFHCPHLALARILELEDREDLRDGNRCHHCGPEVFQRCLLESDIRRHVNVTTKERVKLLAQVYPKLQALRHGHVSARPHGRREACLQL